VLSEPDRRPANVPPGRATHERAIPLGAPLAFDRPPLADPLLALHHAWRDAGTAADPLHPPFVAALEALADAARRAGVPIAALLVAADTLPELPLGASRAFRGSDVRLQVDKLLVGRYYADDG
jgi:hypothetical protein